VPHPPVRELLLELVTGILDALAGRLDVVDADASVAEAPVRIAVAVVDLVIGVVLGAVVVRQLDKTLAIPDIVAMRRRLGRVVAQEVEVELGVRERELLEESHAEVFVELDRLLGILDADPEAGSA
jgi:hypothetical protein